MPSAIATAETELTSLPLLRVAGEPVEPRRFVSKGTAGAKLVGGILVIGSVLLMTLITYGIFLIGLIFSPLIAWFTNRKAMAMIRGSGIRIDEEQLPEIHRAVQTLVQRCGIRGQPEVYLVQANVLNAMAVRFGRRNVILLTDDIIDACLRCPQPDALAFVLAHEVAHVAHGHLGFFRAAMTRAYKKLSRLDEFSADALAAALVEDRQSAIMGVAVLAAGPALVGRLNFRALAQQARAVEQDKLSIKAENGLTHPLLLRRLHRLLAGS